MAISASALAAALAIALLLSHRRGREVATFHGAIEALRKPYALIDADGRAIYANNAFRTLLGDGCERPFAMLEARLGEVEQGAQQLAHFRSQIATGIPGQLELVFPTAAGRRECLLLSLLPVEGSSERCLLGIEDITSRREMEQIIREEQQRIFDFLENAPVGFYSADADGRFVFVNHTMAEWLGTTVDELMGGARQLKDFVAGEWPSGAAAYDPIGRGGREQRGEVTFRGLQGRVFQAFVSQSIVEGDDANELRTRTVVRDLTPEREWQAALKLSEQRFQRFFEDAPVGIVLLDDGARIVECNRTFATMVGAGFEQLRNTPLLDLVTAVGRRDAKTRLDAALAGKAVPSPFEVRLEGKTREAVTSLFVNRFEQAQGRPAGLIVHTLDTTEQKRLEVQFAQSQKMQAVGQLAGGIAHDFNNLLTAMIGFCDLLLLRFRPGDQSFADIMQIKQNANRAANLVRQLLAFSRQQTLQPKVINITDVLAELSHLLQRLIGENITLKMVHGRDLGLVRVDQGQLEQVIINLAVNARDAMVTGGQLTIRTSNISREDAVREGHELMPAGDYVLVEVIDTGHGIAKEIIGRIFEPFFSTKEVGQGTGLGLSTVYGIVKQTGGFVFVDSEPGAGAAFKIYLPRHMSEGETAGISVKADAREPRDLTGVGTVLLVEDEDAVRLFSARALRNKGYKVLEASSGESALDVLKKASGPIDLLITDIVMPRMDGPSLIKIVRKERPSIKIICISGYAEDGFRKHLDASADIHFLPKPFSLQQLAGKVKEVMGRTESEAVSV
ncbi:MAG TPA: PAS domain-containing protein [Alphaproteobacteria bacterium]|nr:PAS domain-containing protein [Alphaproteobacteria bacterium]